MRERTFNEYMTIRSLFGSCFFQGRGKRILLGQSLVKDMYDNYHAGVILVVVPGIVLVVLAIYSRKFKSYKIFRAVQKLLVFFPYIFTYREGHNIKPTNNIIFFCFNM